MMVFFIIFLCRREFRGWVIFDVCWDKKVYKSVALIKKVIKKVKKFPRQSAALTGIQRLKVSKASTFLKVFVFLCWREFREWLQFFLQGYLVIHFAAKKSF